ncbi:FliI/YscN family ATPase [Advenella incenata]
MTPAATLADADPLATIDLSINQVDSRPYQGKVLEIRGQSIRAWLPGARLGEYGYIEPLRQAGQTVPVEIVGFENDHAWLSPMASISGVSAGSPVFRTGRAFCINVGTGLLGNVIDAFGRSLNVHSPMHMGRTEERVVNAAAPNALHRQRISKPFALGVRAIDGLLTIGQGQRISIQGEAGAGKSSLLASMLAGAQADVIVLGLIGERGREVREWIEDAMTPAIRSRTVTVVATSDRPAMERVKAAATATCVAEYFRDAGQHVLLLLDSVTRYARAWREIGLAAGEPPTRRGFPPSLFAALPSLLERAGPGKIGSITGIYTILTESEGDVDPVTEEVTSIVDGHIVLDAQLARRNRFPAIDILKSRSRLMDKIVSAAHLAAAVQVRESMARYAQVELLIRLGEYKHGTEPETDRAIDQHDAIERFLRQDMKTISRFSDTERQLQELVR